MKLGISLPQTGASARPELVRDFAQMAEALGFDSLWVSDHVVFPRTGSAAHPSTVDHPVLTSDVPWVEAIAMLSFVAACTTRPLLGTSVLVVPQRNPVILAKQLASVDVLSGGRLVFGAGIGWWSEEFEALAAPFPNRGRRMDEYLEVIRRCWTEDNPHFEGRFYQLGDVGFYPKPGQSRPGGGPPVWIGAYSSPGFRRAGRAGDGLFLSRTPPEEIPAAWVEARDAATAAGRNPDLLTLTSFARLRWETDEEAEQAAVRLRSLATAGVQHVVLHFSGAGYRHPLDPMNPDMGAATRLLERFLTTVRPSAGF